MGIKNLHGYAKRLQAYSKTTSIIELLQRERVKTTFVDACCVFFTELSQRVALGELLALHAEEHFSHTSPPKINNYTTDEILQIIVKETIRRVQLLQASGTRVCLVIDGQPLTSKLRTVQSRQQKGICKCSSRKCDPGAVIMPGHMIKHCIRLNDEVKSVIVQILQDLHNVPAYSADNPADTSFFVAPFEADPQIVYLAENCQEKNCIYSYDSDLFCYPGALNSVRLMKVNCWCDPLLPGIVADSKMAFLDALNLRLPTEENYDNAERRLLVAAAYSGNDYAQNVPGKAFSTLTQYARSFNGKIHSINGFADKMQAKLDVAKNDPRSKGFSVAVCQFAAPTVNSIEGNRIVYNPWKYNASKKIRKLVNDAPKSPRSNFVLPRQQLQQSFQVAKNEPKAVIRHIVVPEISTRKKKVGHSMRSHQRHVRRSFATVGDPPIPITKQPHCCAHYRNHFYYNMLQKLLHKVCKA